MSKYIDLTKAQRDGIIHISHKDEVLIDKRYIVDDSFFKPTKVEIENCIIVGTKPRPFFYAGEGANVIEGSYIRDCHIVDVRDVLKMSPQELMIDARAIRILEILDEHNIDFEYLKETR